MTSVHAVALALLMLACDESPPAPAPEPAQEPATEPAGSRGAEPAGARAGEPAGENPGTGPAADPSTLIDVEPWGTLLSGYATEDGGFRYAALHGHAEHRALLDRFVASIGSAQPDAWTRDQQLAFYINAYNALTVKSVIELWPLDSVMSHEGFFDRRSHRVAGRDLTLNQLENDVIRGERFAEPRIHFAVNCASIGCPPLARLPYTAQNLESALEAQTRASLRATTQIDRVARRVTVTKLFEWFAGDFERAGGVRAFLARYLEPADADLVRDEGVTLQHAEYDWALNGRT